MLYEVITVDLNTASHSLLSYISGINATVAKNIVTYREENGSFNDRKQLLKVAKLGKKAYEQCAGFLRIHEGKNPRITSYNVCYTKLLRSSGAAWR